MKNLLILRHASPAAQGTDGTDFTRPLTAKGQAEARLQGAFLREADIVPDLIVASSALRALATAELLVASLGAERSVSAKEELYNAPGDTLLELLRTLPDEASTALVVAHMPGVAELLGLLVTDTSEVAVTFAPCTLVGISLADTESWAEVAPGSGAIEWLLPPLLLP